MTWDLQHHSRGTSAGLGTEVTCPPHVPRTGLAIARPRRRLSCHLPRPPSARVPRPLASPLRSRPPRSPSYHVRRAIVLRATRGPIGTPHAPGFMLTHSPQSGESVLSATPGLPSEQPQRGSPRRYAPRALFHAPTLTTVWRTRPLRHARPSLGAASTRIAPRSSHARDVRRLATCVLRGAGSPPPLGPPGPPRAQGTRGLWDVRRLALCVLRGATRPPPSWTTRTAPRSKHARVVGCAAPSAVRPARSHPPPAVVDHQDRPALNPRAGCGMCGAQRRASCEEPPAPGRHGPPGPPRAQATRGSWDVRRPAPCILQGATCPPPSWTTRTTPRSIHARVVGCAALSATRLAWTSILAACTLLSLSLPSHCQWGMWGSPPMCATDGPSYRCSNGGLPF